MFRTVPLFIITSFSLQTQQWYLSCSCTQAVSKPVWHKPLLCVQWKTPDDGHRNCPKHVEFYYKNKVEKLVHLDGFVTRIYHDAARSAERHNSQQFTHQMSARRLQMSNSVPIKHFMSESPFFRPASLKQTWLEPRTSWTQAHKSNRSLRPRNTTNILPRRSSQ